MESALREGGRQPGLRLIETMLWDGAGFPRLPLHLARLERSAGLLGWAMPALDAVLPAPGSAPARVRLTLAADGEVAVTAAPLPASPPVWRLGQASVRLTAGDPWLRVKSTRRETYDQARATMAPGLDEVVLLNGAGEVCDGSITTVFFDRGQGLRTPPLSCGVLPGVLRAEIACPEDVLMAADLPRVRLWVGNAVRGLMPAVWV